MVGSHLLKSWSSTQASIALSSAEAEFYTMIEKVMKTMDLGSGQLSSEELCRKTRSGKDATS